MKSTFGAADFQSPTLHSIDTQWAKSLKKQTAGV